MVERVVFFSLSLPTDRFRAFVDALFQPITLDNEVIKRIEESLFHHVDLAKRYRVNAPLPRNIVHLAFNGKCQLRNAIAAHRGGGRQIGIHGGRFADLHFFRRICLKIIGHGICRDCMGMRGVCPAVGVDANRALLHSIVFVQLQRGIQIHSVPRAAAGKRFLPRHHQRNRRAAQLF
ncbi:hypothetical protein SDC9_163782 [bioreactor metagenome]|uniref:Uncharacterized protein n=1 Tax=bioreactor metagenome TaxID=1076179 RepID=A0A645FS38_9ZZZZ